MKNKSEKKNTSRYAASSSPGLAEPASSVYLPQGPRKPEKIIKNQEHVKGFPKFCEREKRTNKKKITATERE